MNVQQLQNDKLDIINWMSQLEDASVVEKVKSIMSEPTQFELSLQQKNMIDEALHSIDLNGTTPHNVVMEETKKRFPHLYNR